MANDERAGLVGMIGDAPGLTIPAIFVTVLRSARTWPARPGPR